MCTNKIIVRNNSRYIVPSDHVALYRMVNCGECAECMQSKINEYTLRLHYHAMECLNHGGFVFVDCLTYDEAHCPRLTHFEDVPMNYGYRCFSHEDVRLFHVRLRKKLSELGFSKDAYTYFYVGEFGSRNTKRPHYHILFFVNAPISNFDFANLVSDSWYLGNTDNVLQTSQGSITRMSRLSYNTLTEQAANPARVAAISTYIAKYLNKSLKLISSAKQKAKNVVFHKFGVNNLNELDYFQKLYYRRIYKRFVPFHRESKGFGLYALSVVPLEYINKFQKIYFQNKEQLFTISLPLYFTRKLFFTCEKNIFGGYSWIPTEQYKELLKNQFENQINLSVDRLSCLCLTHHVDFPMDKRQFILDLKYCFGRTNFIDYTSSFKSDLCRFPNVDVLKPGFYNYSHPRFQLGVLSDKPLVFDDVKFEVVVTKRLKKRWNIKYKKIKCFRYGKLSTKCCLSSDPKIMGYDLFASKFTMDSERFLSSHGFYNALRVFVNSFCKQNLEKKRSQDLKIIIKQTLNILNYV